MNLNIQSRQGKAKGVDLIPHEAIKNGSESLVEAVVELYNLIKEHGKVPEGWKEGRVVIIHKKGPVTDLVNYRPLTVLVCLSGLFSKVLNARLTKVVEEKNLLGEIQNGFRKGRSGADNNFVLHTILMKCSAKGIKPNLAFIDVRKAYDTVCRILLWMTLVRMGLGGSFVRMIMAMYDGDYLTTEVNGEKTRRVFLGRGVRQGCSLSPMLFALYLVECGRALERASCWLG